MPGSMGFRVRVLGLGFRVLGFSGLQCSWPCQAFLGSECSKTALNTKPLTMLNPKPKVLQEHTQNAPP